MLLLLLFLLALVHASLSSLVPDCVCVYMLMCACTWELDVIFKYLLNNLKHRCSYLPLARISVCFYKASGRIRNLESP